MLMPDLLNGRSILRGVERGPDGINHINRLVLFPPSMRVSHGPVLSLTELAERAVASLVSIADAPGDPVIKAQALTFRASIKKAIAFWLRRAALNERERIRRKLLSHGLGVAAQAVEE